MNVRTLCLGVLSLGEATGYEIKKLLESRFCHFYDASFGSIYPARTKLTGEGMVSRMPNSPLKKASLTGFHATAKHIAAKAVSPSSETMRTI